MSRVGASVDVDDCGGLAGAVRPLRPPPDERAFELASAYYYNTYYMAEPLGRDSAAVSDVRRWIAAIASKYYKCVVHNASQKVPNS